VSKVFGRITILFCMTMLITGCSTANESIQRIALLAPFEGRYSEIGYEAYYAVRLAMQERDTERIELLAIDDGSSETSAINRAKALANDPLVNVVLVLGETATKPEVQAAFGQTPVIIVGQWHSTPSTENVFMLASDQLQTLISPTAQVEPIVDSNVVGGEVFALKQVPKLVDDLSGITVVSSASLPDKAFQQRYVGSGQFVSAPGLLATLAYDAAGIALDALQTPDARNAIATMTYTGINGSIQFVDGYWADAPINYYRYDAKGNLTPEDRPVK